MRGRLGGAQHAPHDAPSAEFPCTAASRSTIPTTTLQIAMSITKRLAKRRAARQAREQVSIQCLPPELLRKILSLVGREHG